MSQEQYQIPDILRASVALRNLEYNRISTEAAFDVILDYIHKNPDFDIDRKAEVGIKGLNLFHLALLSGQDVENHIIIKELLCLGASPHVNPDFAEEYYGTCSAMIDSLKHPDWIKKIIGVMQSPMDHDFLSEYI